MKIRYRLLLIVTIIYIYLPVGLFICGWTKTLIAVLSMAVCGGGLVFMINEFTRDSEEKDIEFPIPVLIISVILIVGICILIGFGGIYPQSGDWFKHNAVLRDLTIEKWPVYYTVYEDSMLTYYLGQYLVPASVGKLFGSFELSNIMMAIWAIIGLFLTFLHLVRVSHADKNWKKLIALLFMFFFCGALLLAQEFIAGIYGDEMYSQGSYHWVLIRDIMLQYRSNLIMLRWVYPQVIVPWIVTMLLMENCEKVNFYVLLILPTVIFGTFSFGALAIMSIGLAIVQLLNRNIRICDILSAYNILPALTLGTVFFFYFLGFLQVSKPYSSAFRVQNYPGLYFFIYFIFCVFMFGIYSIAVAKENYKSPLFYANILVLLILPWFHMGLCNDVVMSGSIPSLFYLMILTLQVLFKEDENTMLGIRKGIIISIFLIGCWYPARELSDNIHANTGGSNLYDGYVSMKWFSGRNLSDVSEDLLYNYYTYDLDGKVFYEHIARKKLVK